MELGLCGKYAVVTGASHGIGRSVALALAQEGCNVAICARGQARLDRTVEEVRSYGVDALGIRADVLKKNDIDRVVRAVIRRWRTVHILVNNVGGGGRWGSEDIVKTPESVWVDVYNKNVLAAIRFTVALLPYMRKQRWGRVVTVTSVYGRQGGGRPWFNVAKCAQTALMKNLAMRRDCAHRGITFNSVAPGAIMIPDTGWEKEYKKDPRGFGRMVAQHFPLGRLGTPEEVADAVAFICSERASLINGASIAVDGSESSCL